MTWLSFQRSELPSGHGTIEGSTARIALQRSSSPVNVVGGVRLCSAKNCLVVVEVLRHRVGRHAVALAVVGERRLPAFAQLEAARTAAAGDVEREPVAHQAGGIFAGPVEEHVGRLRAGQRDLDRGLVGFVREALVDDVHVRMGLLVLGRRELDELRSSPR